MPVRATAHPGRPDRSRARRAGGLPCARHRLRRGRARRRVRPSAARRGCPRRRSTSLAPWRISAWQPRDCGEWIEPGIAKTSRPASTAAPRRDQRARLQGRLDHQRAARQAGDDAVAHRKVLCQWRRAERELADDEAVGRDAVRQCAMALRIDPIQSGADDRDRRRRRRRGRRRGPRRRCRARGPRRSSGRRGSGAPRTRARSRTPCGVALRLPTIGQRLVAQQLAFGPGRRAAAAGRRVSSSVLRIARIAERDDVARSGAARQPAPGERRGDQRVELRRRGLCQRAAGLGADDRRRAAVEASNTACGEPNAASSRRADSRPTPGVSSRRSQAASSSRSITDARRRRSGLGEAVARL